MVAIIKKVHSLQIPRVMASMGLVILAFCISYAFYFGSFSNEGAQLLALPWGVLALVDLYVGLIIFATWAFWRESNWINGVTWGFLILLLGNMISCIYILKSINESNGSVIRFLLGKEG